MRTLGCGGLAALLLTALAVTAARAADDDDEDSPRKPQGIRFGYTGRFGKPRPPEPKKPEPKKPDPAETRAALESQITARREHEFNAYLRRMDACDRLMDIALAANNEEMQRKVEQLSERVWVVYQQHTAELGAPAPERREGPAETRQGTDSKRTDSTRTAARGREKP